MAFNTNAQTYSVKQVSDMSGVSIRTLHHFEDAGLIKPGRMANGYRAYVAADLDRLQQILLYRACGVKLGDIKSILDDASFNPEKALLGHRRALEAQRDEIERLIDTVERTMRSLKGGPKMADEDKFEGLKRKAIDENENAYGAEARQKWGEEAIDAANAKLLAMDESEWRDKETLETAIIDQLGAAMATGDEAGEKARALASMHARWIEMQWPDGAYSREAHLGLAHGYLADGRFRDYYDSRAGQGATEFLVAALEANL